VLVRYGDVENPSITLSIFYFEQHIGFIYSLTIILKPPYIIRFPSKGIGLVSDDNLGSFLISDFFRRPGHPEKANYFILCALYC